MTRKRSHKQNTSQACPVVRSHRTDREMLSEFVCPGGPAKTEVKISHKKKTKRKGGREGGRWGGVQPRGSVHKVSRELSSELSNYRELWLKDEWWFEYERHLVVNAVFVCYQKCHISHLWSRDYKLVVFKCFNVEIKSSIPLVDNHINIHSYMQFADNSGISVKYMLISLLIKYTICFEWSFISSL